MSWFVLWVSVGAASPPAPPAPPPPPAPPGPGVAGVEGTFVGAPCGERKWARTFVFEAGGTYRGQDPVSPCPPGAQCVWSGIISFEGRWALTGDTLALTEALSPMSGQYQRPAMLTLRGNALVEAGGCTYERQP